MYLSTLIFAALTAAAPLSAPVVHENRDVSRLHLNLGRSVRVEHDAILPVRIALTQSNLDTGYDHLMRISDPDSEHFGKHWTEEEIHDHFRPSEDAIEAVAAWLESVGISRDDISEPTSRGWLGVDIPSSLAESMFGTEFYETHHEDGKIDVGCDHYHVPAHLSEHIDYITPGIMVSSFEKTAIKPRSIAPGFHPQLQRRATVPSNITSQPCGKQITPACIRELYSIPSSAQNSSKPQPNGLGIFETGDTYDQEDLDLFYKYYATNVPQGTHPKLMSINGAKAPVSPKKGGGESIVDFELAFSLTYPQPITLYQTIYTQKQVKQLFKAATGSKKDREFAASAVATVEDLLDAVDGSFCTKAAKEQGVDCGTAKLTDVLSISYGFPEIILPPGFANRACNEFMKLALKGHTIVLASGDYGPAAHIQPTKNNNVTFNACIDPKKPTAFTGVSGTVFSPGFPASCPYVLTVGATQLSANQTTADPESAMHVPLKPLGLPDKGNFYSFSSSGGFSNYFKQPGYQSSAVNKFLKSYTPAYKTYPFPGSQKVGKNGGVYNQGGRAFPDVSANGAYLAEFMAGKPSQQFGTSLAAPIWASLITLINNERAAAGKGSVGFINPTLYKNTQIFNDIVSGNAPGCGTAGFSTAPGWDPVTGLGTPKYPTLLSVLMKLP